MYNTGDPHGEFTEIHWLEVKGVRTPVGFARQYQAWRTLECVTPQRHYIHHENCYSSREQAHQAASDKLRRFYPELVPA